jgi:hypothetical protein
MKIFLRPGNIIIAVSSFFAFLLFTQTLQAQQTIYYVRPGGTGTGTGSWGNAAGGATTLQSIINSAATGSQVWVAAGTYLPVAYPIGSTGGASVHDYSFALKSGVALYGGFAGTETALSQRSPSANPTILSSAGTPNVCYHIVLSVGNDNTTILDGFTIQSGNANGAGTITYNATAVDRSYGGGIYCNNSSLVIANCIITNNKGTNGAGIATLGGQVSISNTRFTSNVGGSFGGAMYNSAAAPVVRSSSIENNSAGIGGGIYNNGGAGIFSDDDISSNTANTNNPGMGGGAICNDGASPTLIRCVFTADVASGNSGGADGGAIYNNNSSCVDSNCIFKDDIAKLGNGGAIYNNGGNSENWNCVFVNNSSNLNGGAIYIASGNSKLINSTFYKNKATFGNSGDPAGGTGGGVYIANGNPILSNNIIWGGSSGLVVVSGSPVVQYNDIQGGAYITNGNISADPLFISPSANPIGGDGIWGTADDGLQLINGPTAAVASPAINTGTNTPGYSISYDLLYVARPIGSGIDMGAYEAPLPVTLGTLSVLNFMATSSGPRVTLLQWQVDAQQQAAAYEVQRSMNGSDFTDIGTLSTVRDKTDYSFIDADAGSGNIFYRLKWYQDNNKPDYSIELMINHTPETGRLSLRPSVIDHGSTVLFLESSSKTDMEISITDAAGRLCRRQTASVNPGDNELPLDISSFAGGLYYVNVRLKNGFHQVVELVKL